MTLPLHSDGCIVANIPVKHFLVYFAPKCDHTKLRGAHIAIDATDPNSALDYACNWIRLARLTPVSVTEVSPDRDAYPFAITEAIAPDSTNRIELRPEGSCVNGFHAGMNLRLEDE
jgi:hypothetical protein